MFGSLTLTLTPPFLTLTCIYPLTLTFSLYRPHRHIPGVIVDVWLSRRAHGARALYVQIQR